MPLSVDRILRKARRHAKNGETELAAQKYRSILEKFPKNRRAIEGLQALRDQKGTRPTASAGPSQEQINGLIALYNQGKVDETLAEGEALLRQFPDVPFLLNLVGAVSADLGRLEPALRNYHKALEIHPEFAEAHSNLGNALYALGKLHEAVASYREALRIKPDYVGAHNNLGNALKALGKSDEAMTSYREALRINPDYAEAHNNLGTTLKTLGKSEEAIVSYGRALRIRPDYAEAHSNLGNTLKSVGRLDEAIASYRKALELKTGYAEAHSNYGSALNDLGRHAEAIANFKTAVELKPGFAEAHYSLGNSLKALGRPREALESYRQALRCKPDYAEAHNNIGTTLHDLGEPDEAIASYREALKIKPDYSEAHNNVGTALNLLGRFDEAATSYEQALRANPEFAEAYNNLSAVKRYREADPQIDQMTSLIERPDLPDLDRMHLCFALGKAHGDTGNVDEAFRFLAEGNRLRKHELRYDTSLSTRLFSKLKAVFSGEMQTVENLPDNPGDDRETESRRPIFIVGMPRSGTTLVEQILSSHSLVHGAGELDLLDRSVGSLAWNWTSPSPEQLRLLRKAYLDGLADLGASERIITDKMPHNYQWIGFIVAAMPEAKIVHVMRDARATCWSNLKHYFSQAGNGFAYDLRDVAEYYKLYVDLLAYWHEKFPGRIYDLDYEALTENQEDETRRLLEHVELEWEDRCLEFYKSDRVVRTASSAQVRKKMYRGSSEEWRKYEKHLAPMVELLEDY